MVTIRRILVPTDFSESADAALTYAKALAARFDSELHLLHVVAMPQIGWAAETATLSWPTLLADLETEAKAELAKQIPKADPLGDRVTTATSIGVPVADILKYAAAHGIDLIVMGTHGRGFVGHMFLGSVAERVVRASPVPVLTMHGASTSGETAKVDGRAEAPGKEEAPR
jgi:nucleotide-binding universal stress UspA family protein